jgi:hypothetical protein
MTKVAGWFVMAASRRGRLIRIGLVDNKHSDLVYVEPIHRFSILASSVYCSNRYIEEGIDPDILPQHAIVYPASYQCARLPPHRLRPS